MNFGKLAKLRKKLSQNKGFSLVELIIVIAIMVALVAMLAPQFVKYVQKSRDATITTGAQDVYSMAKSESAFNKLVQINDSQPGTITVKAKNFNGHIEITLDNLSYEGLTGTAANEAFAEVCGVDSSKSTKSTLYYTITVDGTVYTKSGEASNGAIDVEIESTDAEGD